MHFVCAVLNEVNVKKGKQMNTLCLIYVLHRGLTFLGQFVKF